MGFRTGDGHDRGQARVEYPDLSRPDRRQRCDGAGMTSTASSALKLKRGEKTFEYNGGRVVYEILGKEGEFIALTPGGPLQQGHPWPAAAGAGVGQGRLPRPAVGPTELRQVGRAVLRQERIPYARRDSARVDHRARHRAVHHRGRFGRGARLHADHDALPGDRAKTGGVEHRRRGLRLVRARRTLRGAEHPRGQGRGDRRPTARRPSGRNASPRTRTTRRASARSTSTSSSR